MSDDYLLRKEFITTRDTEEIKDKVRDLQPAQDLVKSVNEDRRKLMTCMTKASGPGKRSRPWKKR